MAAVDKTIMIKWDSFIWEMVQWNADILRGHLVRKRRSLIPKQTSPLILTHYYATEDNQVTMDHSYRYLNTDLLALISRSENLFHFFFFCL